MQELQGVWGANVRLARQALGLSQAGLASRANVTRQTISLIEHGRLAPREALKLRIAEALEMTVGELFPWEAK